MLDLLLVPSGAEPVAVQAGVPSWLQLSGVWVTGAAVAVEPEEVQPDSAGVFVRPRIVGRGRFVAEPARVYAVGTVRIRARARYVSPVALFHALGSVRLRGTIRLTAGAPVARSSGAVANPGHWVIVVDDDAVVVASGGST